MIKTIRITGKQQAWLETFQEHQNLLVNCCSNNEDTEVNELTFRFSARPKTVSYEDTQLELINNEIEHFKKVLTPSMHGKLKALFNDDFMYTPRTRRTTAATVAAAPIVEVTPVVEQEILQESDSIFEDQIPVEDTVVANPQGFTGDESLSESNFEAKIVEHELVSSVRGNKHRYEVQHLTVPEFKDLSGVMIQHQVSGLKDWPLPGPMGYVLVNKNGVPYNDQSVEGAMAEELKAATQPKPVVVEQPKPVVVKQEVIEEVPMIEDSFVDTFEGPISVKRLINFDPTRDRISSQIVYQEVEDGVTVSHLKGYRKTSIQGISSEMIFYIDDENYRAWQDVKVEQYAQRKREAALW
jgi:hypothetical protein